MTPTTHPVLYDASLMELSYITFVFIQNAVPDGKLSQENLIP